MMRQITSIVNLFKLMIEKKMYKLCFVRGFYLWKPKKDKNVKLKIRIPTTKKQTPPKNLAFLGFYNITIVGYLMLYRFIHRY